MQKIFFNISDCWEGMRLGYYGLSILLIMTLFHASAQHKEAPSWVDFAEKKFNDNLSEAALNDYSYSGYHFSEKELPDVSSWNTISVIDYGAIPNDNDYDDAGIQAAIDAAEDAGVPTVVYFPAGRYVVSSETTKTQPITISGSNIVLKGAGKATGGTEIFADKFNEEKFGNGTPHYRFMFIPENTSSNDITQVTAPIKKGDFEIEVTSTSGLQVGQYVDLYQRTTANLEANMPGLTPNVNWGAIKNNGIRPYEKHLIAGISGNKVKFKNPVQLNMPQSPTTVLKSYNVISEVGVEDILFTSGWKDYPEKFVHHANNIVDYAWQSLLFSNVVNGWIRDCDFKDWNECVFIEKSTAVTVKDIHIYGKRGHTSYYSRYSYGVLFENCLDTCEEGLVNNRTGMLHGPGMRWSTTSSVFLNCTMPTDQSIDCHGYHPYGNLLDNVKGGKLLGNGGAENAYPNSGPYLTFWNFKHDANFNSRLYDFWFVSNGTERRTHTFAYPNFVGFQPWAGENIFFQNEGLDELRGVQVYPTSLFDAQLQLRLYGSYMSASSSKDNFDAKLANDGQAATFWESQTQGSGQWLMLDFGIQKIVSEVVLTEPIEGIGDWQLHYWEDSQWKELAAGTGIGGEKRIGFDAVQTRKLRFNILTMLPDQETASASITEFKVPLKSLPANNFTVQAMGETCVDKENGKIIITAAQAQEYTVSIDGNTYTFRENHIIEDLSPGTYDLCIRIDGEDVQQCYQVNIQEGVALTGKIKLEKRKMKIEVASGTPPYTVYKNGTMMMETFQTNFVVDVDHGDLLTVKSKNACQGALSKSINLFEDVRAYPNPSNGLFEVYIPNTGLEGVPVAIYNIHSQLISSSRITMTGGKLSIDIRNNPRGVYFAKLALEKSVVIKLVKK